MARYKKKEITANLELLDLEGDIDTNVDYLLRLKDKYKGKGYFRFYIEKDTEYDYHGDSSTDHYLYGVRLETDEEFKKRVKVSKKKSEAAKKAAKTREERKKERELEIYKKLHKKFKGKV